MINKWVRDLIEKYTFITKTDLHRGFVRFFYKINNEEKYVKMPLRGGKRMLINRINKIKENIDYKTKQLEIAKQTRQALVKQPFYFEVVK